VDKTKEHGREIAGDEFLNLEEYLGIKQDAAKRNMKQAVMEINELIREKKWEDAVSLFHPLDEKFPDLVAGHLDVPLREKIGFVLGQLKKYDEFLKELGIGIQKDPNNFMLNTSIAYTAYNSQYAVKNREIFLGGKIKEDRINLAHRHFRKAQQLRPDGVTNFYRQGMLYKQLENKPEKAFPLFQKAVINWDRLEESEKEARHQERKNFIKGLYHLSGTLLDKGAGKEALETIKRCLAQDEKTNYLSLLYKYFALGKVCFHLGRFTEAKEALLFALQCEFHGTVDFVCELLDRTYLALGNTRRTMEVIQKVPENKRRSYYRWTEADVWCAEGNPEKAKQVLIACQEKDNRSRHKSLIRLAKIEYLLHDFQACVKYAEDAGRFFTEKWGNIYDESLFWQSASALRLDKIGRAQTIAQELRDINPRFPKLDVLLEKVGP